MLRRENLSSEVSEDSDSIYMPVVKFLSMPQSWAKLLISKAPYILKIVYMKMTVLQLAFLLASVTTLFVTGCAPVQTPPHETDGLREDIWLKRLVAPPEFRQALALADLEFIQDATSAAIPVRVFGVTGRKTPVIMAHGLQSHSGWFVQSAAFIAGQGHPVYAMDRRGSGLSMAARGDIKDFRDWVDDIHIVAEYALKRHQSDTIYMLGHCFGAIPAAAYACIHPDVLKGLILTSPAIHTKTSISFYDKIRIITRQSGKRDFTIPVPLELSLFTELPEYEEFIRSDSLSLKSATGDFYYQVHQARKFIDKNIRQLTIPVFMAMAGEDPICENRRNIAFFERLPSRHKTLIEYGDARHILEFSQEKERFLAALSCWLGARQRNAHVDHTRF